MVLVLAIGALLIMMGVLAYNGAQRSRRDTARTNLATQIRAAIDQYAATSGGTYPTAAQFSSLVTEYGWKDPKGSTPSPGTAFLTSAGVRYAANRKCGATAGTIATSAGDYAILVTLESGQKACTDSTQ